MSEALALDEALAALRPYITHNLGCEWLAYMGVNRTAAQQRADCKCGFFNIVPPLLRRAAKEALL